jgi:hypothetical protein
MWPGQGRGEIKGVKVNGVKDGRGKSRRESVMGRAHTKTIYARARRLHAYPYP